jgi:hypothetical protein
MFITQRGSEMEEGRMRGRDRIASRSHLIARVEERVECGLGDRHLVSLQLI